MSLAHFVNDGYSLALAPLLLFIKPEFHLSYFLSGVFVSIPLMVSALLQTPVGYRAEKTGQGKMALISGFVLLSLGFAGLSTASSYALLFPFLLIIGLGLSTYHPQAISILTAYFGSKKGRAIGIHGSGGSLASFTTPAVIGVLGVLYGWRMGSLLISFIGLGMAAILHYSISFKPPQVTHRSWAGSISLRVVAFAIIASMLTVFTRGFTAFLPLFFRAGGNSAMQSGLLSALVLVPGVLAQPMGGYLSDRISKKGIIIFSFLGSGALIMAAMYASGVSQIIILILLVSVMYLATPVKLSYVTEMGGGVAVNVALLFGMSMVFASLSPMILGYFIDLLGFKASFMGLGIFAFLGAGLLEGAERCFGRR